MVIEHRRGERPVPENLDELLNDLQLLALQKVERFGWKLKFVRRPLFQEVVPVISSPNDDKIGVLEMNGEINMDPDTKIRLRA
ncbi:MAG: hypothetical protein KZQ99_05695 [Candidatus Thiodiazotropha sp. (ex Dulcina madagascariensis)]|nr:hypothetical protein [Candidatus Thiodiazotropha sp. (ex Epidulcina cf. delphinae)]MCU7934360.1 hypothetical protein [Candidatus Thiodiazotropha sp. (ex Dulcina madagascariensis)]